MAVSCNTDHTDPQPGTPGLTILSGRSGSDTVRAKLSEPLTVQLRDSTGWPVAHQWVGFQVTEPVGGAVGVRQAALVCRKTDSGCLGYTGNAFVADTTNANGVVGVTVVMGTVAATAKVVITAGGLDAPFRFQDTVAYQVRPGNPGGIHINVRDSSAYVGSRYNVHANGTDRYGNVRADDPVTYVAFGTAATIDAAGAFLASAIGRSGAVATSGAFSDTAWISVPPRGTIAAFDKGDAFGTYPTGVVMVNLDGSGYRLLVKMTDTYYGTHPDWTAAGQVVYESGGYSIERLYVADTLGQSTRLTAANTPTQGEMFGAGAPDGSIFLTAAACPVDCSTVVWRVSAPGGMPERIGPNPPGDVAGWKPSPSPDGLRLAYFDGGVSILTIADGSPTVLVPQGNAPRWSPLDEWITFSADTTLYLIQPDGTGRKRVGPVRFYDPRVDWSPDGKWLIARTHNSMELIEVASGATIPLPWATHIVRPSWRR